MKKQSTLFLHFSLALLLLTSCRHLKNIAYAPPISPQVFLQNQPWIKIEIANTSFIWSQPSSTIFVFFVGLFSIYTGFVIVRSGQLQQSKLWWGVGLVLTGLGALFAGTSYQALGYEIKCNGRQFCTWTSWWEVTYLLLSTLGMNTFLVAAAYTSTKGPFRKALITYAALHTIGYSLLLLGGILFAIQFAVSFECMVLVAAPSVLFLIAIHTLGYANYKDKTNATLRNAWLLFVAVGIAYRAYLISDSAALLWQRGIWFTENDVLHLGMISWVYYLLKKVSPVLVDCK